MRSDTEILTAAFLVGSACTVWAIFLMWAVGGPVMNYLRDRRRERSSTRQCDAVYDPSGQGPYSRLPCTTHGVVRDGILAGMEMHAHEFHDHVFRWGVTATAAKGE